jgi:hypothetical protein
MRWSGNIAHLREIRNSYDIMIRQSQSKSSIHRTMLRWTDNNSKRRFMKMDWAGSVWLLIMGDFAYSNGTSDSINQGIP